jgi:hypothetical protein
MGAMSAESERPVDGPAPEPGETTDEHAVDPHVVEAVESVENRFGAQGLEDLIALATEHLETARRAMDELAELAGE